MTDIHPTALIDPQARIGDNVQIGAFAIVEGDVAIGEGTTIGPHTLIADGARIGKNCRIHNGAVVATLPQDLKFGGEATLFEIGDNTTIREFATLNRGTAAHGKSSIGSNCLLMAYTHVAHDCTVGNNVIMSNGVQLGGHVTIEDWAIIGGMTPVHQFCHVGQHCMIGGGFRVIQDVPPYILASEEPLRFCGLNSIGLRRRGFSSETLLQLKRVYRLLYRSNLNVSQAVERIKAEFELTPEITNILRFIETADRGILH
ncbi:MAG TPA: acyl-ACP--UDP-N-acetylglucosamine O-acyltransferase [bacterium]|nr:acyl-ACP--UDP-N-acetylglucosamine O-acyltransferase [bacterium]HQG46613.1 acyl-ACP--UDP-N-acetylglucosamine O-acyltransferase [bacterium]HQI47804.1 acyl-ACP--UDP-N-acetylglucosamine O-acyltransferase [bacterium]HQJ65427.1 acyl-ACP--UDP-N-acetylglucosamine O-acyltransferase [bacterium]